jgi:hypothetical protein
MTTVVQARPLLDSPADLDLMIDELKLLQTRARELERRLKPMRAALIAAMSTAGMTTFTTAQGTRARLHTTTRWHGDRAAAKRLLGAELLDTIFSARTSTSLEVE